MCHASLIAQYYLTLEAFQCFKDDVHSELLQVVEESSSVLGYMGSTCLSAFSFSVLDPALLDCSFHMIANRVLQMALKLYN